MKKRSTGARSATRPWCRKITSSPRRRAWPRLWVVMTILVPAASKALDDGLDLARRAGIEVGGGLVEEQHLGMQRPGARQREALLLAAREHARRPLREVRQADLLRALPWRRAAPASATPATLKRVDDVGERRAAQHHRPLEHHRLLPARARRRSTRRVPTVGASRPCISRISTLLPAPFAPRMMVLGPGLELERHAVDDRAAAGGEATRPRSVQRAGSSVPPLRRFLDEVARRH